MSANKEIVSFEPEATPHFPATPDKWYMVLCGSNLVEVAPAFHSFQVPFEKWDSEDAASIKAAELLDHVHDAHPESEVKVVFSRGSGKWDGFYGLHFEGQR